MTKLCQTPTCLLFSLLQLVLLGQTAIRPTVLLGLDHQNEMLYNAPLSYFLTLMLSNVFFFNFLFLGKSTNKICFKFLILKSIAFINQLLMFPALINLTSTKPVLQNLPCLSWPHLSNKKGQNLSSKFLNTTTSNLYNKVFALCIFYTCCFIAHAKYSMN